MVDHIRIEKILRKNPYFNYRTVPQVIEAQPPAFQKQKLPEYYDLNKGSVQNPQTPAAVSTSRILDILI